MPPLRLHLPHQQLMPLPSHAACLPDSHQTETVRRKRPHHSPCLTMDSPRTATNATAPAWLEDLSVFLCLLLHQNFDEVPHATLALAAHSPLLHGVAFQRGAVLPRAPTTPVIARGPTCTRR
jgi:hypothetical protein